MTELNIACYLGQRTLIAGDVNSGKTTRSAGIFKQFLEAGYASVLAVIDLAPDPVRGVGGKLTLDLGPEVLYLTTHVAAPRLMGQNPAQVNELAEHNARSIETLFTAFEQQPRDILFINDATLYLQAGNCDRLLELVHNSNTVIINAYYGHSFPESELSQREREQTEILMRRCDAVIQL